MSKEIFALDIGTRKVMGIIARKHEEALEILDVEVVEHSSRPMFDGQIHSIDEVTKTVKKIKDNLESRLNKKLEEVGVAVAGRNLVTYKSKAIREFDVDQEITVDMIRDIELEAVDKIISESLQNLSQFYCVGYSPVYYELDGHKISNLVGHYGKSIATEIIATFLPRIVLDSMFAVLKKVKLEATNITLEPISAINAIIPKEMRNLNIILVDIGAGTSDLALTRDNSIFAYGMVPEAGDEITERISEILLVDFATAERIKRSLYEKKEIVYDDIWGRTRRIDIFSLRQVLLPAVKKLAEAIAKKGLELNAAVPQAIVVVGGGSLTYNLINELAISFAVTPDKIGIRLPSVIKGIKNMPFKLSGPEAVTPIGIAQMTANAQGLRFIEVEVNHKKLKILDFHQKKDIMGAITFSGILSAKKLYPRPGLALTVRVNGELKIIKGSVGNPAQILVNGKSVSSLSEKITDGDKIEFIEAVNGQDARILVGDLVEVKPVQVILNQDILQVEPSILMNDQQVTLDASVCDRAEITTPALMIRDVLINKDIKLENLSERQILVNINGTPKILTQRNFSLTINSKTADLDTELKHNDVVEFLADAPTFYRICDVIDIPQGFQEININVDGKDIKIKIEPVQVVMNGQQVRADEFLIDGADIRVYYLRNQKVLLSEIFRYIDFDPQRALGKRIKILVDDQPAGFTTPLVEGSRVNIILEER